MLRLLPLTVALVLTTGLRAQLPTTPAFDSLATALGLVVNAPANGDFRLEKFPAGEYLSEQLAVYSRNEKLEIRLRLEPVRPDGRYYQRPGIRTSLLAMNLGSNAEDAVTTVHSFDEEELNARNADWAAMYTFRPKRSVSDRQQAQLVAIYKQGRGLALTLLLFDRAPVTLEARQFLLGFGALGRPLE